MSADQNAVVAATPVERPPLPPSPCTGICTINETHGFCCGCGRTSQDITVWPDASLEERSAIWRLLPERLAKLGVRAFRLPATPTELGIFVEQTLTSKAGTWDIGIPSLPLRFDARGTLALTSDERSVQARNSNGDDIRLIKHDRMRAFGLADENSADRLAAVALALPRGRAEVSSIQLENTSAQTLATAYPFARFSKHETTRLRGATALGEVEVTASHNAIEALQTYIYDQEAPGAFGIPRAFAVCAVFHSQDPGWLAGAIGP